MRTQLSTPTKGALAAIFLALLLVTPPRAFAQGSQQASGGVFAVSDGRGQVSLMWFPQPERWPMGGWKIEDSTGRVVAARVSLGDPEALKALSDSDAAAVQSLPQTLASPEATGARRQQLFGILAINALGSPAYARALGLSSMLQGVPSGQRTYKVSGLDATGQLTGLVLTSAPLDSSVATPLPPAPANLSAQVGRNGVSLIWSPVPESLQVPAIAYYIVRDSSGQKGIEVTPKPVMLGTKWNAKNPAYIDQGAPVEDTLAYHVSSVDVFGRKGPPADIRIFFPDFTALDPPEPVLAAPTTGGVSVTWKVGTNPHTAGYVVERAYLYNGPFEALTPQAVAANSSEYADSGVRGGTAYYYRVRAVGPRGDLGPPSHAAMVQPKNPGAPPKPASLKADLGTTRIRLTWTPVQFPVAGYFIERLGGSGSSGAGGSDAKAAATTGTGSWVRLNSHVTPEALYDDFFGATSDAKFSYRIVAVAFDNAESSPSDVVSVVLPDTSLPGVPVITDADGSNGKAALTFAPGLPEEKTAQFLVLRGGSPEDMGVVIGDPLPGASRNFEDAYVEPGNDYWYRLVAVDKNGNHSDPTRAVAIRVGAPSIPTPAAPAVQFTSDPFPQARIQFAQPAAGLAVMVEVRAGENGRWLALAGPIDGQSQAVDPNPPPKDPVFYRILYRANNGATGSPSAPAQLQRK
jgi:hypothetical protein